MTQYEIVKKKLDELNIKFDVVEHPPATTTELADKFIEGKEGVRTKTMFLTNKKKTAFFLLIMDDAKRLDMKYFGEFVSAKSVRMASESSLMEKMQLEQGVVSPFGLLNNKDKDIKVYMDEEIINEEVMTFHPNTNEATVFIKTVDLKKYLKDIGYELNVFK